LSIDGVLFLAAVAVLGDTVGFPFARRERLLTLPDQGRKAAGAANRRSC